MQAGLAECRSAFREIFFSLISVLGDCWFRGSMIVRLVQRLRLTEDLYT